MFENKMKFKKSSNLVVNKCVSVAREIEINRYIKIWTGPSNEKNKKIK